MTVTLLFVTDTPIFGLFNSRKRAVKTKSKASFLSPHARCVTAVTACSYLNILLSNSCAKLSNFHSYKLPTQTEVPSTSKNRTKEKKSQVMRGHAYPPSIHSIPSSCSPGGQIESYRLAAAWIGIAHRHAMRGAAGAGKGTIAHPSSGALPRNQAARHRPSTEHKSLEGHRPVWAAADTGPGPPRSLVTTHHL